MIRLLLHVRFIALLIHRRILENRILPIKKQKGSNLKKLIGEAGIDGPNEEFAYARYLKASEFSYYSRESGSIAKYSALRSEMRLRPIKGRSEFYDPPYGPHG